MKITEILLIYAYIVICIESIKKVGFVNMSTKRECRDNVFPVFDFKFWEPTTYIVQEALIPDLVVLGMDKVECLETCWS